MLRLDLLSRQELSRRRARLMARIHRRGIETITQPVEVGPLRLTFTRVADPNRVLDQVAAEADRRERVSGHRAEGDELHLPYWAELWDSAIGIGQFLTGGGEGSGFLAHATARTTSCLNPEPRTLNPPSVLDLGCGMGFTGMVAAALGARRVVLADLEADALLFARLNTLAYGRRAVTRRLNWQRDRLAERFELILGADVLYERAQWEHLEPFWRAHLSDGGAVLLGEPGRKTGDLFIDWIVQRGWELERFDGAVPTRSAPIRVFRIAQKKTRR